MKLQRFPVVVFAIGMLGMGILGLVVGDFAMVWQPVDAWVPARRALAYAVAALMVLVGAGLLFRTTRALAARVVFPYVILWTLLKVPALIAAPGVEGVWLGIGELVMLMAGAWVLYACYGETSNSSVFAPLSAAAGAYRARVALGLALLPVGLSHIVYTPQTIELVPHWLPFRMGFAILTGLGQMACGLGILFGVWPRVAAFCEAGMVSLFALLVWAPRVLSAPKSRLNWTAFWISWVIAAAVWVVAQSISSRAARTAEESVVEGESRKQQVALGVAGSA